MSSETNDSRPPSERLFSYGTLQQDEVQLTAFGRNLSGEPDALTGYRVTMTATADQNFNATTGATSHRNLEFTGNTSDVVEGTVFLVTPAELKRSDSYEPFDYERLQVRLRSGLEAWVYLKK